MTSPAIRLTYNTTVINKATRADFIVLSNQLRQAVMSPEEILEHLTLMGHPICCADLSIDEKTGFCQRDHGSFISSQIVGIDIDETDVPFEAIADDPWLKQYASFAYTTASHTDEAPRYRIMIVLQKPITVIDEYKALVSSLIDKYDADQQAKDAVRIWYGSANAKTIVWGNILPEKVVHSIVRQAEELKAEERSYKTFSKSGLTIDDVREMLKVIPPQQAHIEWKKIIAAVASAVGDGPEVVRMLEQWSPSTFDYGYALKHRLTSVTPGTLIWHAKNNGWRPRPEIYDDKPTNAIETLDKIETYLASGYQFRKNKITTHIEIRPAGSKSWERISDYWVNSELRRMRAAGLKVSPTRLREIIDSDFSPEYDAIADYFDNLIEWREGDPDWISQLVGMIPFADYAAGYDKAGQREWYEYVIRKWLVATVACAVQHKPNHTMIVLQGGQGIGKTTFLRYLVPDVFRRDHYFEGMITGDKDVEIKLSQAFMAIDDELEGMSKKSTDLIKQLITRDQHTVRHPYAHFPITTLRRVSFAGSVNRRSFLSDETGSRRFPVIAIGGDIRLADLASVPIDRIWAQAKALLISGFEYWWVREDMQKLEGWNKQFETNTHADDLVFKWIQPAPADGSRARLSATEILQAMSKKEFDIEKNIVTVNDKLVRDIGRALVRAGYEARGQRHQGHMKSGYAVTILSEPRKAFGANEQPQIDDIDVIFGGQ